MQISSLLKNKVCVVVGASSLRGIGYAAAELFVAHGAKIVALDIAIDDTVTDQIAANIAANVGVVPELIGVQTDIQNRNSCDAAISAAVEKFGTIDCLVNSAAIVAAQGLLDIAENDLDRMIDINLKGAFNICRSALKVFEHNGSGTIVNVASVAAQRGGGLVGGAHYAASKGGVLSLTKTIAREFGPKGIRANAICPSMTETGMLDGNVNDSQFKAIVDAIPLKRAGKPIDIANACLFLSSEMSAYITGTTLDVNGGSHIH
ncbi:MAG: NAD(P)-dependent dehydrogenase (short-subunit alcohol dehydrogenase family) [Celeribacter sp.]|jgi:NAD(P)-dependent dehydrogenase (short-subunit alcohol dehydrogenase family)